MLRLHVGDSLSILPTIDTHSVQLIVTSPPYGSIIDYGMDDQIGYHDTYQTYLSKMDMIWKECTRIIEPGCRMAINIGDQYVRKTESIDYQTIAIQADYIRQIQSHGMLYLGMILWKKISNTSTTGGCSMMGSIYYPRDGYISYEHEYILLFKKPGIARKPSAKNKELSKLTIEQRSEWFRGIWDIKPNRQKDHPATYPVELPERLIRMYTFYGETVLDPFVGSGSTLIACRHAGRDGVGIELNPEYAKLTVDNLSCGMMNYQGEKMIDIL